MPFVNDIIALQIVRLLVQPFNKTKAYVLHVIDANGKLLKDPKLFTKEEADSYDALHRIVFRLKQLLGKIPGGQSKLASIAAAYWLVKEQYSEDYIEEAFDELSNVIFVEEYLFVEQVLSEDGGGGGGVAAGPGGSVGGTTVSSPGASGEVPGGSPANRTGKLVSTDQPVIRKKDKKKYFKMVRRDTPQGARESVPDVNNIGGVST